MSHLTKPQLRATIMLSFAILLTISINTLYNQYRLENVSSGNTDLEDARMLDSLLALIPPEKERYPSNSASFFSKDEPEAEAPVELNLHSFDPNTVTKDDWLKMGLPEKVFYGLEKYRSKGGRIRKPEQILKLYNLEPSIGQQLVPFVKTDSSALVARNPFLKREFKPYTPKPVVPPFDLNKADSNQLKNVFGIGGKTAARILKYRNSIGGFLQKEQVFEVWGLDTVVVEELFKKSYLPPNPDITRLKINQLTEEELANNPYIRKGMARIIVKYRTQHGPYKSAEDLLKIKILKPEVVSKISPYLEF
jgi:DNA uptake protein ComE-like DNA-binding protein